MDIIIADENRKPLREIVDYTLDCAFGDDENTIEITADQSVVPPNCGYAYIDGTEYGGTIDEVKASTTRSGCREINATGRSWHGILAGKRLVPDSGQSHITVSGRISTVLQGLIKRMGLDDIFTAPDSESDNITVSGYQFERFVDGYTGLKDMCRSCGAKLTFRVVNDAVYVGGRAVVDYGSKVDSDLIDFDITKTARCTNHLVCGGTGENENRAIVHFYADENGNVSKTQSLFGVDEIAAFYDYSNADESKLEEDGKKKLEEMQSSGTVEVSVHDDLDIDIGDIVAAHDNATGLLVSAEITKKITKVSNGVTTFEYEVGTSSSGTSASTISGTAESSNEDHAYYAGNGISIDNYTISADVNSEDLAGVTETASEAIAKATSAVSAAGKAQQAASDAQTTADAAVATISASSPIDASRDGNAVSIGHANSGVSAGAYGATDNKSADWGDTVTVGARMSVNVTGHVTNAQGRTVTLPGNTATQGTKGLMSASDKKKLDGVEQGANKTTVDSSLSATSTNPVQNKIVKDALDDKANSDHNHSANDITSGLLPISRGGLGGSTATESLYNLFDGIDFPATGQSGNVYLLALNPSGSKTTSCIAYVTDAVLWQRIYQDIKKYVGPSDVGALSETGNANSASKLQNKRTIAITGAVSGQAQFDGSKNITITVTGDSEAAGFLAAHPVGSIYQTTVSDNPGTLYGGTWVALPSVGAFTFQRTA